MLNFRQPSVRRFAGACFVFLASIFLAACILTSDQAVESNPKDPRAPEILDRIRALDLTPRSLGQADAQAIGRPRPSSGAVYLGNNGAEASADANSAGSVFSGSGPGFDLNFENAPVASVAKVIIGDILGATYTIDVDPGDRDLGIIARSHWLIGTALVITLLFVTVIGPGLELAPP